MNCHIRRLGMTALLLGALLVPLAAQPVAAQRTHRVTNLTAWSAWGQPPTIKALHALFDMYNRTHPNVHWSLISGPNIGETKLLSSIVGGNAPDMAFIGSIDLVGSWGRRGALTDLTPLIQRDHFSMAQFTPGAVAAVQAGGHFYALPFFEDTYMLYYNKDDFKAAGLNPNKPPATISQLEADAAKLTIKNSDGSYKRLGFVPRPLRNDIANLWGGHFVSADSKKITTTDPNIVASTQWMVDYWHRYGPSKIIAATVSTDNNPRNDFVNNRVAMFIGGEYYLAQIAQDNPKLNIGVAPIPYLDSKPQYANSGTLGGNPLLIPKGSHDVNAAWDLIKWFATTGSIEVLKHPKGFYVADLDAVPALKVQAEQPTLTAGAFPNLMLKFWRYSAGKNIHPWPSSLVSNELTSEYYNQVQLAVSGKETAAQAMANVQAKVQPDLDAALASLKK
jgi:multiple sugar transport system substrate-binding protein